MMRQLYTETSLKLRQLHDEMTFWWDSSNMRQIYNEMILCWDDDDTFLYDSMIVQSWLDSTITIQLYENTKMMIEVKNNNEMNDNYNNTKMIHKQCY